MGDRLHSALTAGVLSFASPKESSQRKGDPDLRGRRCRLPCATRRAGRLRNSPLRSSDSARRLPPALLRCSALQTGDPRSVTAETPAPTKNIFHCGRPQKSLFLLSPVMSRRFSGPLERRRATQGLAERGRALSEGRSPELRSPRQDRVAQGTPRSGAPTQGRLFFAYFLLAKQKKVMSPVNGEIQRFSNPRQARNTAVREPRNAH